MSCKVGLGSGGHFLGNFNKAAGEQYCLSEKAKDKR